MDNKNSKLTLDERIKTLINWRSLDHFFQRRRNASGEYQGLVQMELINFVADDQIYSAPHEGREEYTLVSELSPCFEERYRTLHQTNWTAVIDQMALRHYRNWTTFLAEEGEHLLLFTYFQYCGKDKNLDDQLIREHPTTQRWWKLTIPCLIPLENTGSPWSSMEILSTKDYT